MGISRNPRSLRLWLLLGSAACLAPGVAFAASGETTLETVVVTAQKREENLQTVPVAVTALTRTTLAETHFVNLRDIDAVAPGVTVREGAGGIQNAQFSIRGVYATGTFGSDAGVAFYSDGVYIASTLGTEFDLADVERIEVLRGPQGTLFGRNTIGGAISVITKEPSGQFSGHLQVAGGNLGQRRVKANLDLPAFGIVSVSGSLLYDRQKGDIKNLGAGTVWHWATATNGKYGDLVSPKTLGGHTTKAGSLAVKVDFTDDIKAVYRFNYSHKIYTPDGVGITGFPLPAAGLGLAIWSTEPAAIRTPISNTRPDAVNNWYTTPGLGRVVSHSLTTTATVMNGVTLKDVFGYRKTHVHSTNQLSGLGGVFTSNLPTGLNFYGPGVPLLVVENATENDQETTSNEFQVNIDIDRFKSTFGHLYYRSTGDEGALGGAVNTSVLSGLASPPWLGFNAPVITTPFKPVHNRITTQSQAVYGHTEFKVTDQLSVVGGVRYTKDKRRGLDGSPTPAVAATLVSYQKGTWTYLLGVNYQVTDDIFTYVHYSTGYISGGQIANLKFDPQTAKSWEAGVKADLLDRRLRVNAALFNVKYGQVQTLTAALTPHAGCSDAPGVSPGASQCIINGGDARARGLELEATAVPLRGVTLTGNAAYTDMQYTKVSSLLRAADGTFVVQYIPKYTANFSAMYRGPDAIVGDAHINARLDASYSSRTWAGSNALADITQQGKIPARFVLNGRAGLAGFKVGGSEMEVAVFGKNLLDNKKKAYSAFLGLDIEATYLRARTYGVELDASF